MIEVLGFIVTLTSADAANKVGYQYAIVEGINVYI